MAGFRADTQEMRKTANVVEQLASDYTRQVDALYAAGEELDSMWDGDANDSFNAQMGQDKPRFDALNAVIGRYVQALRDNAEAYDKAEAESQQTLQTKSLRRT